MKKLLAVIGLMAATASVRAAELNLIPWPAKVEPQAGQFTLNEQTVVTADAALTDEAVLFAAECHLKTAPAAEANRIRLTTQGAEGLGDEAYRLEADSQGATIHARTTAGAFYGCQTLRQLLQPEAKTIPFVKIEDAPRFAWRGFMLDVSRHFFDQPTLFRVLDRMADGKLNRFHIHLTDDQGWRLAIGKYPELTQAGARGNYSDKDAPPRFFTRAQMQEIVRYAAQRHIIVVPEIDMPGHAHAAARTFPELSGGANTLNPASDATYDFLQNTLREVVEIFPSPWIHVGGDEVNAGAWKNNAAITAKMSAEGLKDPRELKTYFMHRIAKFIEGQGRTPAVWHEALATGPDRATVVFLWRPNPKTLKKALDEGHPVVLAPAEPFYFSARAKDAAGNAILKNSLEDVYRGTKLLADIPPAQLKQILGLQACIWAEHIATVPELDDVMMPRLEAMAETAWTPDGWRDFVQFSARLQGRRGQ